MSDFLKMSRRIRRTPYTSRIEKNGVSGFTVVNHMLLPKSFQTTTEDDYWHLRSNVQVWDVSCQRQVEIVGPDAEKLVQWMTPRDISICNVGHIPGCLHPPRSHHASASPLLLPDNLVYSVIYTEHTVVTCEIPVHVVESLTQSLSNCQQPCPRIDRRRSRHSGDG